MSVRSAEVATVPTSVASADAVGAGVGAADGIVPDPVLDVAAAVFAKDPAASLQQVASQAGIGRTTLHKQYATRHDLLVAIAMRALDISDAAIDGANAATAPLDELVGGLLPYGAYMTLLMQQPEVFTDSSIVARTEAMAAPIAGIVATAGPIRSDVPDWWLVRSLHALLFTAWDLVQLGWLAPRDAPSLVRTTFTAGVMSS